jgi:hypothetical protein
MFARPPTLMVAHDGVLPRLHALDVDTDVAAEEDSELGGAARQVGGMGARHQGLGRRAAGVDASAAEELALDDADLHPGRTEADREERPRLAGADDDRVEAPGHDHHFVKVGSAPLSRKRTPACFVQLR